MAVVAVPRRRLGGAAARRRRGRGDHGRDPRAGRRHRGGRSQPHRRARRPRSTSRSSASAPAGRARRSRSPTRSRSSSTSGPSIAVVTEEFATHGRNMATYLGHPDLKVLVLPYPLEARPEAELLRDRGRVLPAGPRAPGGAAVTLTGARSRSPPTRRALRAVAGRGLGRRRPAAPAHRRRDRGAARDHARRARRRARRAAPAVRRRDRRARRGQRGDGRRPARGVPARARRARSVTTPGVQRVRAHHHDVERVPDADRERPVARRPRHRLPRRLHGRRRRARLDDDRARGVAVPAQHRRPARRRDVAHRVRPAGALRHVLRRVGGAVAVAVARAAARASPPTPTW